MADLGFVPEVVSRSDERITQARSANIAEIADRLGARLKRIAAAELAGPCPACGGTDRFSINVRRRVFNCRSFGGGDTIAMVQHALGLDFLSALEFIAGESIAAPDAVRLQVPEATPRDTPTSIWLWKQRRPITQDTPAWGYLREARGYARPLPVTLGYLPARNGYPPSLIAAFALCTEPEPGVLAIADADVRGVHVTRLTLDGIKAGTDADKITIGTGSAGSPIVLAPPNDGLGLAVTEGIEDGLSVYAATGLGVWAAGTAGRMPALADAVPPWIDCVSIIADSDTAGVNGAEGLLARLKVRGIAASISYLRASE